MLRPPSFKLDQLTGESRDSRDSPMRSTKQTGLRRPAYARGIADYLRSDDKMAAILPAALRMAALQKDCADLLPAMFEHCAIVQFESENLVLSAPTSALATRLKQQLPKLQSALQKRGWQVSAIRLKVQVRDSLQKVIPPKEAIMPSLAVSAFAELGGQIEKTSRNAALLDAIAVMLARHQGQAQRD